MEDRADLPPDERHRRARPEHARAAERRQLDRERLQPLRVDRPRRGVERDGDIRLRRRHQIDRQPVPRDAREDVGEEAHTLPHTGRLEREQHDATAPRHRLDPRRRAAAMRDHFGAVDLGRAGVAKAQRHAGAAQRPDATRVKAAGPGGEQLDRLLVSERAQQPRRRHHVRIGGEEPRRRSPRLATQRRELRRETSRGAVGTPFDEHRPAVGAARRPAGGDHDRRQLTQPRLELGRRLLDAVGGEETALRIDIGRDAWRRRAAAPVVAGIDRGEQLARIDGGRLDADPPQPRRKQRHRQRTRHRPQPRSRSRPRLA